MITSVSSGVDSVARSQGPAQAEAQRMVSQPKSQSSSEGHAVVEAEKQNARDEAMGVGGQVDVYA